MATTMRSSINENPRASRVTCPSLNRLFAFSIFKTLSSLCQEKRGEKAPRSLPSSQNESADYSGVVKPSAAQETPAAVVIPPVASFMITPVWSTQNVDWPVVPGIAGLAVTSKLMKPAVQPAGSAPVHAVFPPYLNQYPLLRAVATIAVARVGSSNSAALQLAFGGFPVTPTPAPSMPSAFAKPMPYVELYVTSAVRIVLSEPTADASFAAMRERSRFGIAIAAMIRMIATTINSSISEKPF